MDIKLAQSLSLLHRLEEVWTKADGAIGLVIKH